MEFIVTEKQLGIITEQLGGSQNDVFKKLESLKSWLFLDSGLGLRKIIDDLLKPMKTNIGDEDILKFSDGAKILKDAGKINDWRYNKFVEDLPNKVRVHVDGKWHPVNKLNTNYSDLAKLLSDLLHQSKSNGRPAATEIIETISNTKNESEIKKVLLKYKDKLRLLFDTYLSGAEDLLGYTQYVKEKSQQGESVEEDVANSLSNLGYEIIYRGGDGDFIDMLFSTDIIVKTPNGEIKTIQVKTSEWQSKSFIQDFDNGKHKTVDLLIYPKNGRFNVISTKTKKITTFR
jgi:hypothetical protein